ncbi:MAG TPA: hypothetical protein VGN17_08030 [Bryobacteraceae bacterium]|jgi:hypothetical protein
MIYLALAILMAPVAWWLAQDRAVWLWDQSWYGEVSTDLWFYASHFSLREWATAMIYEMNLKPPGVVWIGQFFVPLHALFGDIENALLVSVLVTQALLLWTIYKIGEALKPAHSWTPFVGVIFAAATQSFVGLSHQFMVEPLQALAVAWVVLIAAKVDEWPGARILVHLAAATLLGALAKLTTPAYCLLFYPYIAYRMFMLRSLRPWREMFSSEWSRISSRLVIVLFALIVPVTALWYTLNAKAVWQHARDSASGEIALAYGFRGSFFQKLLVWTGLLNQTILSPYLAWTLALACVAALLYFPFQTRAALFTLSLAQIAIVLALFSLADAVESRYLYALIVFVSISVTVLCSSTPRGALLFLVLVPCAVQWSFTNNAASGRPTSRSSVSPLLIAADPGTVHYQELTRIVALTSNARGRYNVVGVEEPWLNANGASFFAAKQRLATGIRSFYTSLGYAEKDAAVALKRLDDLNTHYLITLDEQHQNAAPNFLNAVSLSVLKAIRQDPRYRQLDFPSTQGVLIFERQSDHP